jgi:hypothetical protein
LYARLDNVPSLTGAVLHALPEIPELNPDSNYKGKREMNRCSVVVMVVVMTPTGDQTLWVVLKMKRAARCDGPPVWRSVHRSTTRWGVIKGVLCVMAELVTGWLVGVQEMKRDVYGMVMIMSRAREKDEKDQKDHPPLVP